MGEKIFVVMDYIFWGIFFLALLQTETPPKIMNVLNVCFLVVLGVVLLFCYSAQNAYQALGYANLGKCVFCIYYFYGLFKNLPKVDLWYEPSFWIVTGLLFYSAISTPIYLSINIFLKNHFKDLIGILFPLTNIAIIIMHLLFLKGYLCIIQRQKI
jgi:hypothetical protein